MSFYQCQKCKKKWQYPISKCPDCFSALKDIKGKEAKVIGVSKTTIPTIFHPKVNYFVLVLEDENGNHWTHKSVKEYKIGDKFVIESGRKEGAVALWRVKYDILESIEKVIELLGGTDINKKSKILILPTLLRPKHPYFAENTSPQFLGGMLKYLIKKGIVPGNIKVACQSFNDFSVEDSAKKSQLFQVCLKNKVSLLDLAKTNFVKKEREGLVFEITEEAFNNDLIINLPIMKLDPKEKVRGAVANVLKLLKKEFYRAQDVDDLLEKTQGVLPRYLTLAEGIYIQKSTKYVTFLGLVLAGFDSFNLDRVFAEITMVEELPKHLKDIKIENIPIAGRHIDELSYEVEKF